MDLSVIFKTEILSLVAERFEISARSKSVPTVLRVRDGRSLIGRIPGKCFAECAKNACIAFYDLCAGTAAIGIFFVQ